jgi:hypothetical protein
VGAAVTVTEVPPGPVVPVAGLTESHDAPGSTEALYGTNTAGLVVVESDPVGVACPVTQLKVNDVGTGVKVNDAAVTLSVIGSTWGEFDTAVYTLTDPVYLPTARGVPPGLGFTITLKAVGVSPPGELTLSQLPPVEVDVVTA